MRPEDNPADEAFERDLMLAEIATLTRQLAEANEENDRVCEQLRSVDDTLNALGCSRAETFTRSAAIQGIADEREKWLTASRVLCGAHVGVPQPTCPVCALTTVTAQRDAMRGALEEIRTSAHTVATVSGMTLIAEWVVEQCDRALGAL